MLGISSLLKNTCILGKTSCNTWRRYISVNDKRRMNSTSQWRHRMTVHAEETLSSQLAERACKISWRQSTSGFCGVLFKRRYNCLFVLSYSKIPFYSSLPTAILLQFEIFSFPTTSLTSSSQLTLSTNPYCNWLFFSPNFLYPCLQYAKSTSFSTLLYT